MTSNEVCGTGEWDAVTVDAFLGGALQIFQPRRGYRAGLDAVLLAAAVPAPCGDGTQILDAGAGVGVAGLSAAWRNPRARVVLVEKEAPLVRLAAANIARNGFAGRVTAVDADISARAGDLVERGLAPGSFAHLLANPPFHEGGATTVPPVPLKAAAHTFQGSDLETWLRFLSRMCAAGGTLSMIYRADALGAVLCGLQGRFGALRLLPIHPRRDAPAIRVVIQGVKGSRAPLTLAPAFILHGDGDAFTPEAEAVLRHGAPLPFFS